MILAERLDIRVRAVIVTVTANAIVSLHSVDHPPVLFQVCVPFGLHKSLYLFFCFSSNQMQTQIQTRLLATSVASSVGEEVIVEVVVPALFRT